MRRCIILLALMVLACKPAPARLEMPMELQNYLCDKGRYTTTIPIYAPFGGSETALVSFYSNPSKSFQSFVGMATFKLLPGGTLGMIIQFQFADGPRWLRDDGI